MKIIKINTDHYVIVDDSKIKEGDYCLMFDDYGNLFLGNQPQQYLGEQAGHHLNKGLRKITHSTEPLELLSENGLSGMGFSKVRPLNIFEVKELIGEVDVEKKMISPYPMDTQNDVDWCNGYQRGYNQALKDNKEKKYTEEDISKALSWGYHTAKDEANGIRSSGYGTRFIQSLQPKTEWDVEFIDGKLKLK